VSRVGLVVLVILLAAAISLLAWLGRLPPPPPSAPPAEPLITAFAEDAVREIDIDCGGTAVTLARGGSPDWRITRPFEAEADLRQVETLIGSLRDARVKKVVGVDGGQLQSFGLSPAACAVRLSFEPASAPVTIRLGRSSPVGSERYAAADDARVVLTDGNLFGVVAGDAEGFREKRLFPVESDAITRIALDRPDGRVVLARSGSAWRLEAPSPDAASASACEGLARAISEIEIVDPDTVRVPVNIEPGRRLRLEVATRENDAGRVAFVAAAGINGRRLGWREGAALAGLIDESALGELLRPAESMRERRIASFSSPDVRRITLEQGGTSLRIARAGEASPWSGTAGAVTFAVDGHRVDEVLDRWRVLTASGFAPAAPKSERTGTLSIEGESATLASFTWGPLGADLWLTTPSRPGVIFQVDADSFGPIPANASDWARPSDAGAKAEGAS
jgi:Domain of unknown function (DUF4340)